MGLAANSLEGKAQGYLKRIETLNAEAESAKGKYLAECKERNEDRKEIFTEAKSNGVPVKALRGLVKQRALTKKIEAIADGLDEDEAGAYETLVEALGDLGRAAARKAGYDNGDDGERDLRPRNLRTDQGRADETALGGVGKGPGAKATAVNSLADKPH